MVLGLLSFEITQRLGQQIRRWASETVLDRSSNAGVQMDR